MASAFESLYPIARGQETYYSLSEAKQTSFNTTAGPTLLAWISRQSKQILSASKEEQQIVERQFHTECQEPVLLISENDLTKLFYYGNRDPFLCNWVKICSLGVWTPDATPHSSRDRPLACQGGCVAITQLNYFLVRHVK